MTADPHAELLTAADFAGTAALVGEPARAQMLMALMDGRALTATELARVARVTPQTASGHLSRMTQAGLIVMERHGRHHYHRLGSPGVARMLEGIMSVASEGLLKTPRRPMVVGPRDQALRHARTCYDHLAGEVAVAIADRMVERDFIQLSGDGGVVTDSGARFLGDLGIDVGASAIQTQGRSSGRIFCRPCFDWSERRPHVAGAVGAAICKACFSKGWLRRARGTRAVTVTPVGRAALRRAFDLPTYP